VCHAPHKLHEMLGPRFGVFPTLAAVTPAVTLHLCMIDSRQSKLHLQVVKLAGIQCFHLTWVPPVSSLNASRQKVACVPMLSFGNEVLSNLEYGKSTCVGPEGHPGRR